ncbi:hypothetical protein [Novilysobacter spongiicola]|uniref:Uncharacterized protein n=1 Tax=Lysobacter spongiicola DSM 21749 TaxID=1122188 RepID=A0A1T4SAN8_9GAMM|nr:hypothetical protein [Lysobacter spongiicola]SKA25247.1 hypothetical protein SAMN02745674_02695 [Lysobacter spongiicola DSM 21749]
MTNTRKLLLPAFIAALIAAPVAFGQEAMTQEEHEALAQEQQAEVQADAAVHADAVEGAQYETGTVTEADASNAEIYGGEEPVEEEEEEEEDIDGQ